MLASLSASPPHQFPELLDIVKFFEFTKGKKEPVRAYSLTSAPHEKYIAITIKPEIYEPYEGSFPPLLSPLLASDILVGKEIQFTGYAGAYVMPEKLSPHIEEIAHLVAGSGIVPSFSILKSELNNKDNEHIKHTIVYANKSIKDIIFHEELLALEKQFPHRLCVKYFLSQEKVHGCENYIHGRPDIKHIKRFIKDPKNTLFFACGPAVTKWQKKHALETGIALRPRFMEWVQEVIEELQVDKKQFKREIYG